MPWRVVTRIRYSHEEPETSFDDLNSAEFVNELQSGSSSALDRLVDGLLSPLCHFLTVRMNIPEGDAEDVAIDVFMKVHGKIGTFRYGGPAKLTTWIFQIAKNHATDCHRSSKAEGVQEEFDDHIARHSQPREGAYAGRNTELLKWLNKELAKLSEQDQSLLKWRALEIPYAQISEWLGISEGAARVRHKRAMEKLLTAAKSAVSEGAVPQ